MATVTFYGGPCNHTSREITGGHEPGDPIECQGRRYYVYPISGGNFDAFLAPIGGLGGAPRPADVLRGYSDFRNTVQAHIPTSSKRASLLASAALRSLHRVARFHG